jgi:hypothetical protein
VRLTFGDGVVLLVLLGFLHGRRIAPALKGSFFCGFNRIGSPGVACEETATEIQKEIRSSHVSWREHDC